MQLGEPGDPAGHRRSSGLKTSGTSQLGACGRKGPAHLSAEHRRRDVQRPRRSVAVLPRHVVGIGQRVASTVTQKVGRVVAGDNVERHRRRDRLGVSPRQAGEAALGVQHAAVILQHFGQCIGVHDPAR
jgi:hypothetical protein